MISFPRAMPAGPGRERARRRGFTLLELLLVLVVVSIAFGIVMPLFLRSFQGHRLRTAGRAMTMVAKYAKNMSVLRQRDLVLRFDLAAGQVDLVSPDAGLPGFSRSVEGVALAWVRRDGQEPVQEGTCEITFFRNGTCQPFALCIRDPSGNAVELKVDAVGEVRSVNRDAE